MTANEKKILKLLPTDFCGPTATAAALSKKIGATEKEVLSMLITLRNFQKVRCAPGTGESGDIVWSRC